MQKLTSLFLVAIFASIFLTACGTNENAHKLNEEENKIYTTCLKDDSDQIEYIYENICETELRGLCKNIDGKAKTDKEKCYQIAQDRYLNKK